MRRLFLFLILLSTGPVFAEIQTADECVAVVVEDPASAREEAGVWTPRLGGGLPARLCEATALEALGADATAARLLTSLPENTNRAMDPALRATIPVDAARLWHDVARPDLARTALAAAEGLTPPDTSRMVLCARSEAAMNKWQAVRASASKRSSRRAPI